MDFDHLGRELGMIFTSKMGLEGLHGLKYGIDVRVWIEMGSKI